MALRKKSRFFALFFEPSLMCPQLPGFARGKCPQAALAVPAPSLLLERAGLPSATGPLHVSCSLPASNLPLQHRDAHIIILHSCFSGKPAPSPASSRTLS